MKLLFLGPTLREFVHCSSHFPALYRLSRLYRRSKKRKKGRPDGGPEGGPDGGPKGGPVGGPDWGVHCTDPLGHLNFWKNLFQIPPSPGQKGDQMPPPPGKLLNNSAQRISSFTGTWMKESRLRPFQLLTKI